MSTISSQIYGVAAADSTLLGLLADGAAGLRGGDASLPPPAANAPWAYLALGPQVPRFPLATGAAFNLQPSGTLTGSFQWWVYDSHPRAGYVRIRAIIQRLRVLYGADRWNATVWLDADTGEDVYGLQYAGTNTETADPASGELLIVANWQFALAYRPVAA